MQAQRLSHLSSTHGMRQILLVCKDKEGGIAKMVLSKHAVQLVTCGTNTIPVVGVHHEDDAVGVVVVMSPQRADLVLSPHIPYGEADVFVLDCLDIET